MEKRQTKNEHEAHKKTNESIIPHHIPEAKKKKKNKCLDVEGLRPSSPSPASCAPTPTNWLNTLGIGAALPRRLGALPTSLAAGARLSITQPQPSAALQPQQAVGSVGLSANLEFGDAGALHMHARPQGPPTRFSAPAPNQPHRSDEPAPLVRFRTVTARFAYFRLRAKPVLTIYIQKAWHGHGAICPGTRRIRSIQIIVCMWALHHIGSCPTIGSERGRIGPGNNHLSGGWRPPRLLWPEKSASSLPDACLSARMALSLRN